MEPRSLESRLNARVGLVLGSLLVAPALLAPVATDRTFRSIDESQARDAATAVARTVRAELEEGDSLDAAAGELASSFRERGLRVRIDAPPAAWGEVPSRLSALAPGACGYVEADLGSWRGCAAAVDGVAVTAAINVDGHRRASRFVAAAFALALFVLLAGTFLAVRTALRGPLRSLSSLARWADGVAGGALSSPPTHDATLEIARLSSAFEALVGDLTAALRRERDTRAYLAHELRTPLTAIVGELDHVATNGEAGVARLRSDASRLTRVIDSVLLLADPAAPSPSAVVNVADLARELGGQGIAVDAPDEALVVLDPDLVHLALMNLLDNASRHADGPRAIRVTREADRIRVGVVDGGAGADAEARRRMFEPHWRASAARPGFGLGLSFVRAFAERHGGFADARAVDEGGLDVGFTVGPVLLWHEG